MDWWKNPEFHTVGVTSLYGVALQRSVTSLIMATVVYSSVSFVVKIYNTSRTVVIFLSISYIFVMAKALIL